MMGVNMIGRNGARYRVVIALPTELKIPEKTVYSGAIKRYMPGADGIIQFNKINTDIST
jgi:hypothetical protein